MPLAHLIADSLASHPVETGGVLLGWREPDAVRVVRALTVPSPDRGGARYLRSKAAAEASIEAALAGEKDPLVGYVGEWHSHPRISTYSLQDRREMHSLSALAEFPLALIVAAVTKRGMRTRISGLIFHAGLQLPAAVTTYDGSTTQKGIDDARN
jgi:proteasome lid subunit RPN8/RPN11